MDEVTSPLKDTEADGVGQVKEDSTARRNLNQELDVSAVIPAVMRTDSTTAKEKMAVSVVTPTPTAHARTYAPLLRPADQKEQTPPLPPAYV